MGHNFTNGGACQEQLFNLEKIKFKYSGKYFHFHTDFYSNGNMEICNKYFLLGVIFFIHGFKIKMFLLLCGYFLYIY